MNIAQLRVRFYNCDPLGVVYFVDYFRIAEDAFVDILHGMGITWKGWQRENPNVFMPIVATGSSYHSPSRFDDLLTIKISLLGMSNKSLMLKLDKNNPKITHIRYEGKPTRRENLAASFKFAKGEKIIFIDADLSTHPRYIHKINVHLQFVNNKS